MELPFFSCLLQIDRPDSSVVGGSGRIMCRIVAEKAGVVGWVLPSKSWRNQVVGIGQTTPCWLDLLRLNLRSKILRCIGVERNLNIGKEELVVRIGSREEGNGKQRTLAGCFHLSWKLR